MATRNEEHMEEVNLEEGITLQKSAPAKDEDTKSQTSTTPSSEADSTTATASEGEDKETTSRRRKVCLGALLLISLIGVACVIAGVVVGTQKETQMESEADTVVVVDDVDVPVDVPVEEEGKEETIEDVAPWEGPVQPIDLDNNNDTTSSSGNMNDLQLPLQPTEVQPPLPTPEPTFPKPFGDIQLSPLNEDALQAYATIEEWEADLTLAAKRTVNHVILQNVLHGSYEQVEDTNNQNVNNNNMEAAATAGVGASTASAAGKQASQAKIQTAIRTSHTNNREADADEADLIKTDGKYVYAAYGDYLVVWDRQGHMVSQAQMPDPSKAHADNTNDHDTDDAFSVFHAASFIYIDSIQLTDTHVLVTTGGMDNYNDDNLGYGVNGTHLRVYLKPTTASPSLTLVASQNIHGYFVDARYLEQTNSIHICTGGDFDVYNHLVEPLDLYHYPWMNQTEYYEAATRKARDELIPQFVTAVTQFFLSTNQGQWPTTMKLNTWKTAIDMTTSDESKLAFMDYAGLMDEAFRAYMQVTSIQVDALPTTPMTNEDTPLLAASTATVLGPSSWGYLYATQDSIVLNVNQYQWNSDKEESSDVVHLIHLKVDETNGSTSFYGLGSLPGTLPNRYSVDIQGTDMRVATTQRHWFPLDEVWQTCGDSWYLDDECMDEETWNVCFDFALTCRKVVKTGCPYTFICEDNDPGVPESSTENLVSVFDIGQPGIMKERGSITIGEPHDVITAVHFGETFSYAVTLDQRDPFYILNLAAGQAPAISGTLKLDGSSSYLQPLDASLLVGIGQNVTGTGFDQHSTGLLVTIFDVSNTAAPVAVASINLEDSADDSSTLSDAEVNHRAIQYTNGRLVIPLSIKHDNFDEFDRDATLPPSDESKDFEGFVVLDVGNAASDGILEILRINHASPSGHRCHYCAGFNNFKRSFLFEDDSLMTIHDNLVVSTDLGTGTRQWTLNMTIEGEDMTCCH